MKRFNMGAVWGAVNANPGIVIPDLVSRLQMPYRAVRTALYGLKKRGLARYEGTTRKARWYALGRRPTDQRGLSIASLANLKIDWNTQMERLRRAHIGKGRDPTKMKPKPMYVPQGLHGCALERCWRGIRAHNDTNVAHDAGAGYSARPYETQSAAD